MLKKRPFDNSELKRSFWLGNREMWRIAREVILEAVDKDGSFLDIGCANGLLLKDLCAWVKETKGIELVPYGIDIDKDLIKECKEKNSKFKNNFFVVNMENFIPKKKFTFIHSNFSVTQKFLAKYLKMLEPDGRLILTLYDDKLNKYSKTYDFCRNIGPKLGFRLLGEARVDKITYVLWLGPTHI